MIKEEGPAIGVTEVLENGRWVRGKPKSRAERRKEQAHVEWQAAADRLGITLDKVPDKITDPVVATCGCKYKARFKARLATLDTISGPAPACTQCGKMARRQEVVDKLAESGARLVSHYGSRTEKHLVACSEGHEKYVTLQYVMENGYKCRVCNLPKPEDMTAVERTYTEVMSERGEELVAFASPLDPGVYVDRDGNEVTRSLSSYRQLVYSAPPGERFVRVYFDDKTMRSFVMAGPPPPRLPREVRRIVDKNDFEVFAEVRSLKGLNAAYRDAVRDQASDNSDYNCINVQFNPTWLEPGVYTWGRMETMLDGMPDA